MTALKMVLASGVAAVALVGAAPASAQYYPNYGYNNGPGVVGQVIQQVLGAGQYGYGNGYGGYGNGYGGNSQYAVTQCARAVENRVNRDYGQRAGAYGYGGYGGYNGYPQRGGARVVGITSVEPRSNGRLRVRGVVTTNAYGAGYGGGYGGYAQPRGELSFKCNIDYRGYISDIDLDRNTYAYRRY